MSDTADAELRDDGRVPIDAPCVNAYVVDVIIVDPSTDPPVATSIDPTEAEVGGAPVTLTVTGTGFTQNAVILFNGGPEPTTFVSPTELTTEVRPATASGPATVPVQVRQGARYSDEVDFTFIEPADLEAPDIEPGDGGEFDPSEHTVAEVQEYIAANPDDADRVLEAERAGKGRASLVGG